jgi:hypothetical protein
MSSLFFFLGCLYLAEMILLVNQFIMRERFGYIMWVISFGLLALSIRENKAKQEGG